MKSIGFYRACFAHRVTLGQILLIAVAFCFATTVMIGCGSSARYYVSPTPDHAINVQSPAPLDPQSLRLPMGPEIWIVERSGAPAAVSGPAPEIVTDLDNSALTPFIKLAKVSVRASVRQFLARTDVAAEFRSGLPQGASATLSMPLPPDASINDFVMTIGTRQIRGVIRDAQEARKIYDMAIRQGFAATLVREDQGTISVALGTIPPEETISVNMRYFQALSYRDGWFEYVCPVPPTEISDVTVHLSSTTPIDKIESPSSQIAMQGEDQADIRLAAPAPGSSAQNVVVRYRNRNTTADAQNSLLVQPDGDGGYFALLAVAPVDPGDQPAADHRAGVDLRCIVVPPHGAHPDWEMRTRNVIAGLIAHMKTPDSMESFTADSNGQPPAEAMEYAAGDPRAHLFAVISDGSMFAGGGAGIANLIERSHRSGVLLIGIDPTAGNKLLMESVARRANTTVCYSAGDTPDVPDLANWVDWASRPVLTDLQLAADGVNLKDIFPHHSIAFRASETSQPLVITGRYEGAAPQRVICTAQLSGNRLQWTIARLPMPADDPMGIDLLWAKMKITDLADQYLDLTGDLHLYLPGETGTDKARILNEIRQTALEHALVSPFTSLLAVDASGAVVSRSAPVSRENPGSNP